MFQNWYSDRKGVEKDALTCWIWRHRFLSLEHLNVRQVSDSRVTGHNSDLGEKCGMLMMMKSIRISTEVVILQISLSHIEANRIAIMNPSHILCLSAAKLHLTYFQYVHIIRLFIVLDYTWLPFWETKRRDNIVYAQKHGMFSPFKLKNSLNRVFVWQI